MPPESLLNSASYSAEVSNSELKVSAPADKSAPAQKALPLPVMIIALTSSSSEVLLK